jgi:hypothetical protein
MAQRRTTHRSRKGTKLYAVRKADGTFSDIQTYKRAHAADVRASAKGESSAKSKAAVAKKTAKGAATKSSSAAGGLLSRAKKAMGSALKAISGAGARARPAAKKVVTKAARKSAKST